MREMTYEPGAYNRIYVNKYRIMWGQIAREQTFLSSRYGHVNKHNYVGPSVNLGDGFGLPRCLKPF